MARTKKPELTMFFWCPEHLFEPPGADKFYAAVGRVLMRWGHFDSNITCLLGMLRQMPETESLIDMPLGDQVDRKLESWKNVFSKIPALTANKDMVISTIPRLRAAAHKRHVLAHGNWQGFTVQEPLALTIIWHRERKSGPQEHHETVTVKWLTDLATEIEHGNNVVMSCSVAFGEIYRQREGGGKP